MGSRLSRRDRRDEDRVSRGIDAQLKKDHRAHQKEASDIVFVLLGTSNAGKSTMFKQMLLKHSQTFRSVEERAPYTGLLRENLASVLEAASLGSEDEPALRPLAAALRRFRAAGWRLDALAELTADKERAQAELDTGRTVLRRQLSAEVRGLTAERDERLATARHTAGRRRTSSSLD